MKGPRRLRRQLRIAAKLLNRGVINELQYSALAIRIGYDLMGAPIQNGAPVEVLTFGVRLSEHLGVTIPSDESYRRSFARYGPYNTAALTLKAGSPDLIWTADHQNVARWTALHLSLVRRWAFRFQEWWKEQEHFFPLYTKMSAFILGLIVEALVGGLLGRLTR